MSTAETILEIKGLNKYFGPTHANKNIDFSLKRGEIKGLIGENGREVYFDFPIAECSPGFRPDALKNI